MKSVAQEKRGFARRRPAWSTLRLVPALTASLIGGGVGVGVSAPAQAKILAGYVQGHGGLGSAESNSTGTSPADPGIGIQAGARFLIFEAYADRTSFGGGASVGRAIFGLRAATDVQNFRLVIRGGLGAISEQGGALSGRYIGAPDRFGGVARAGVTIETEIAPSVLGGFALDGEVFTLTRSHDLTAPDERVRGSDVFLSLHLKFEIGI